MVDYDELPPVQAGNPADPSGGVHLAHHLVEVLRGHNTVLQSSQMSRFSLVLVRFVQLALPGYPVPQEALIEENGAHFAYVYQDGKAVKKRVQVEMQSGQQVIMGDIQPGDQLIMMPGGLTDGESINVIDPYQEMMDETVTDDIKG